jgi:hypothetical protein
MGSRFRRSACLVLLAAMPVCSLSGCGGSNTPTTPSPPQYPAVAGNYSGTATFNLITLGASLNCPASTTVTQSGASVTLAALALSGSCASLGSLPLGSFTISTTGALVPLSQNNVPIADCNGTYNATASGGFSGSTLQFAFAFTAVSGGCVGQPGNFNFSGTLTKQ